MLVIINSVAHQHQSVINALCPTRQKTSQGESLVNTTTRTNMKERKRRGKEERMRKKVKERNHQIKQNDSEGKSHEKKKVK